MPAKHLLRLTVVTLLSCGAVLAADEPHIRTKRQFGFSFGNPGFGNNNRPTTGHPGRQNGGGGIDLGSLIGSVVGGFVNPGSQGQTDNVAGAIQGFNQAVNNGNGNGFGNNGACGPTNGGCEQGCRPQGRFVRCFCNAGFVLNRDRRSCSDINECRFNNAGCSQNCQNTPGTFACTCVNGFTLASDTRSCVPGGQPPVQPPVQPTVKPPVQPPVGGCADNNGGCEQKCVERRGRVRCQCNKGFRRNRDGRTCHDTNECRRNKGGCHQLCTNTDGSFTCSCPNPGWSLAADGLSCTPSSQPTTEPVTPPGGPRPVQPVSCNDNNGGCSQGCQQTFVGVRCFCSQGYLLNQQDRNTCSDLDECSFSNGGCSEVCTNTDGSYACGCSGGGNLLGDGRTCSAPAPTCSVNNGGCQQLCNPAAGVAGIPCACKPGYQLQIDGRSCTEINECQSNNGNCEHICMNQPGSYVCQCQPGFSLVQGNRCQFATTPTPPATPSPSVPSQLGSCGVNNKDKKINPHVRIVGGRPANPDDWPWMAAILRANNNRQFCGAVLITSRHCLTAAHCVRQFSSSDLRVRVAEYDFTVTTDGNELDFNVQDIEAHEQYDTTTQENDIAILRLESSVPFSNRVQPVCLPPPNLNLAGQHNFVIGWGTTSFSGSVSNVLQEVQIPTWSQADCEAAYPDKIFPKMMCAGLKAGGKDSCQGDSGGPLLTQLTPGSRVWTTVGVVSWGIQCALADNPGVYTKVDLYLDWINEKTKI